jgi:hypothetical protein
MALTELTDRAAVLSAMQEYDTVGQAAFLAKFANELMGSSKS